MDGEKLDGQKDRPKTKDCCGDCCYCKLVDKKSDPFPGLRKMFGGACDGPMISTESVEAKAEEQLKSMFERYKNTQWGEDGPIVEWVCSERLACCPLYPLKKDEFVWVPDRYMGRWIVDGGTLILIPEKSRPIKWRPSFLNPQCLI